MVQRAVAGAIARGRGDGGAYIGTGAQHGIAQAAAPAPGRRPRRWRACSRCRGCGGCRCGRLRIPPSRPWSPAGRSRSPPGRCPPFSSTAGTPSVSSASAAWRIAARSGIAMPDSASASGRLGVITDAIGSSTRFSADSASGVQQTRAALGDHHRVEHQRHAGGMPRERGGDNADHLGGAEHAGLDDVRADVVHHHGDLLSDEIERHRDAPRARPACSARSAR